MRDTVRSLSHRPFIALVIATALSLAGCDTVENVKGLIVGQTLPPPVERVAPSSGDAAKQSAAPAAAPAIADTSQGAPTTVPPAGAAVAAAPPTSPARSTSVAQAPAPLPAPPTATAPAATAPVVAAPAPAARAQPPTSAPTAASPAPAQSSGAASTDPDQEEALTFYEDVMLTYAFDACGLPLLGAVTRQDIAHRLDVCPAPAARKEALRVVYQRAIADAERDPAKTRAGALALCADKRAFLRNVLRHANELTIDDNAPPNCSLITPPTAPPRP